MHYTLSVNRGKEFSNTSLKTFSFTKQRTQNKRGSGPFCSYEVRIEQLLCYRNQQGKLSSRLTHRGIDTYIDDISYKIYHLVNSNSKYNLTCKKSDFAWEFVSTMVEEVICPKYDGQYAEIVLVLCNCFYHTPDA